MKRTRLLAPVAALLLTSAGAPLVAQTTTAPLIPRDELFSNPDRAAPRLSPNGVELAFLAPVDGVMNIWVGPAEAPHEAKPVTRDNEFGISSYFWAHTNEHIVYMLDESGDRHWRLYSVDLVTGEQLALTPASAISPGATDPHPVTAPHPAHQPAVPAGDPGRSQRPRRAVPRPLPRGHRHG